MIYAPLVAAALASGGGLAPARFDSAPIARLTAGAFARTRPPFNKTPFGMYLGGAIIDSSGVYFNEVIDLPSGTVYGLGTNEFDFTYIFATGKHMLYAIGPGSSNFLYEYALGQSTPTLAWNNDCAQVVAAAPNDDLFTNEVTSSGCPTNVLAAYKPGATTPYRVISRGITTPVAVEIHGDDLYVSNGNNIVIFPRLGASTGRTITSGINGAFQLAFDAAGNLLVLNSNNSVTIYAPGASSPTTTITDGISGPSSLAVGPTGTVYVANAAANDITEYDNEQPALSRTITHPTHDPVEVAVDQNDTLFEVVQATVCYIWEFPSGSTKSNGSIKIGSAYYINGAYAGTNW